MHINCLLWLDKFLNLLSEMAKNAFKLSTMVGEIFELILSQMAKTALKLSVKVREILVYIHVN